MPRPPCPPQSVDDVTPAEAPARPGACSTDWRKPLLLVLLVQVLALSVRAWLETRLLKVGALSWTAHHLSYLVVPPLMIALLWPVLHRHRHLLAARLRRAQLTARAVLLGIAVGLCLRIAYWGGLVGSVSWAIVTNPDPLAVAGPQLAFDCPPAVLLALHVSVMAALVPMTEEIINRGLILQWLLRHGRVPAVLASALLFAIFHAHSWVALTFLAGIVFGILFLNSRSLWPVLIAHATFNGLVLLDWRCLRVNWNPAEVTTTLAWVGAAAFAVALAAALLCGWLISKRVAGKLPGNPRPA